jgi:pimeloyl-ACP methyl ester carboxylesterase
MDRSMETRRAHPEDAAACHAHYRLWFRPFFADASALSRSRGDCCAGTTVPNVGHFPYLEARDQFFAAIDTFMAGAWPAGAKPGRYTP